MNVGWIRVHRKIWDSEIWEDKPFARGQAWIDILLLANHQPKTIFIRGNEVHIERGQFVHSERTLAARWGWSTNKIRGYIRHLIRTGKLNRRKTSFCAINTVINYNRYQSNEAQNEAQKVAQKVAEQRKEECNKDIHTPIGASRMKPYSEPIIDGDTGEYIVEPKKKAKTSVVPQSYFVWQDISTKQAAKGIKTEASLPYHKSYNNMFKGYYERAKKDGITDEQIESAIKVYATVLENPKCYWTHRWNFGEFLQRGLKTFLDKTPQDFAKRV